MELRRLSSRFLIAFLAILQLTSATRVIESDSLVDCAENPSENGITPQRFEVTLFPDNYTLTLGLQGFSTISGKIIAVIGLTAYGYQAESLTINPCLDQELKGICPMITGSFTWPFGSIVPLSPSTIQEIPGIAYTVPDLDATATIKLIDNTGGPRNGSEVACIQANLSNGKTVYQAGVGWSTAVIAGLALLTSAIVSGLGHSNTATHVAANAMSLFSFFQGQALFGMTAVPLPPIVRSWTQNFQWSLGIIHVGFIQSIATWYQRSTGGTPSTLISNASQRSINIEKRGLVEHAFNTVAAPVMHYARRAASHVAANVPSLLSKRQAAAPAPNSSTITLMGIERVGFVAGIEPTDIFMTGYIFFIIFIFLVVIGVVGFKWILEWLARSGKIKGDKFLDFRNGWTTVLKGVLFRLILIGFPQMVVLSFWEFTRRDSGGEVALAALTIVAMFVVLGWVAAKVILIARRSITLHKNPAYILYSDPVCLHKWGFLYVYFKATAYWFIIPVLGYTLVLGSFVAFGQPDHGTAQAIGLLIINAGLLIALSILRPYMDKKTNGFNISIAAVNFLSSIFLLFFTDIFDLPGLVVGVMGVVFFVVNAAFALVLLILVLVAIGYAIFSKNPDVRYQPMRDDRASFIKSQTNLNTELDALGATARGENKGPFQTREIDTESVSSGDWDSHGANAYSKEANTAYASSPFHHERDSSIRSTHSQPRVKSQYHASPWQRGAGYDG